MSEKMNKIEKLINDLCPEGVEFKKLGNCSSIKRGKRVTKSELHPDKKYPVYSGGVTPMGFFDKYNQSANTITIVKYGTSGFVNFITEDFWANDVSYCIKPNKILNNKYLFYVLKSKQDFIQSLATNAIPSHLPTERVNSIKIPIPPLPIQEEIVKILDNFTELKAELEAELKARKKQYEYYREELLTFGDDVRLKILGKILNRTKGTPITAKKMNEMNKEGAPIKIFAGGRTVAYVDYGDIPEKDVLTKESIVVKSRGIIGFEYIDKPFSHKNEFWSYNSNNSKINIKYIYYYLKNKESFFQSVGRKMSKMPQLSIPDTDKFKIPIPPLSEQEKIVSILDKFDALVNDISLGLPAEIAARKKQYEYYREKLLTFKEKTIK